MLARQFFRKAHCLSRLSTVASENIAKSVSVVKHPYALTDVPLSNDTNKKDLFAVVEFSGTQYKVTNDDVITANRVHNVDIGDEINLTDVLLVGNRITTVIGSPKLEGVKVVAAVEEHAKDRKVTILKIRRRKNSKSLNGFRRQVTTLRIKDIVLPADIAKDVEI